MGLHELGDNPEIRLQLTGITKRFLNVTANDDVSLDVRRGEVLAILGENGAGKSTLMRIVSGMLLPDEGSITVDGKVARIRKPADARRLGIGMVYQHFSLATTLTVAENLALSGIGSYGVFANLRKVEERVREMSRAYHMEVDPKATIGDLSVGARQRVEIIKLLFQGAEIFIFDEPTAVLTPLEWAHLVNVMRKLVSEGYSIVLITHKLDELMGVADRCTVLRQAKVVGTVNVADTSKAELATMTIGREVMSDVRFKRSTFGEAVFATDRVRLMDDHGRASLDNMSLEVRAGEILGVAGVDGNGQRELVEVITGLRTPVGGRLRFDDQWLDSISAIDFYRRGGSVIPADRHHTGLVLDLSVRDNLLMKELALGRMQRRGVIDNYTADEYCKRLIKDYDIRTPSLHTKVRQLSGGNQQKIVLARELARQPRLLIAAQPTRGLDVGATEIVLSRLQQERERGCAIVFVSTELEEIIQLSDRVAVMVDGKFIAILEHEDVTYLGLGLLMGGEAIDEQEDLAILVEGTL